jgi:hypothetical protein
VRYSVKAVGDLDPSRTFQSVEEDFSSEINFGDAHQHEHSLEAEVLEPPVEIKFKKIPFSEDSQVREIRYFLSFFLSFFLSLFISY